MRCKCCNRMLRDYELGKKRADGVYEDLCGTCLYFAYSAAEQENEPAPEENPHYRHRRLRQSDADELIGLGLDSSEYSLDDEGYHHMGYKESGDNYEEL